MNAATSPAAAASVAFGATVKRNVVTLLLLLVAVSATSGVAAVGRTSLSPSDEATHVDYAYRFSRGEIVREGQQLDQATLREWACRGFYNPDVPFPTCEQSEYSADDFPAGGRNYSFLDPPTYHAVTGVAARVIVATTPIDSFVTAARLVGLVWIVSGLFVAHLLLLQFGVSSMTSTAVVVAGAFLPAVWQTGAAVSSDNAAILAGASVGLVAALAALDRAGLVACAIVSLVAVSATGAAGLPIFAAAVYLSVDALRRRRDGQPFRRPLLAACTMFSTVPLARFAWKAVQSVRSSDSDYANPVAGLTGGDAEGTPFSRFFSQSFSLVAPDSRVQPFYDIDTSLLEAWSRVADALLALGPLAVALALAHEPVRRRFGAAVGIATTVGATAVAALYWWGNGSYQVNPDPGHELSLLPLILACVGFLFAQRAAGRNAAVFLATAGAVATVPAMMVLL